MKFLSSLFLAMFLSLSFLPFVSLAATDDTSGDGVAALTAQAEQATPTYDGITVEQPTVPPSAFGSFWRGLKENVSLTFTFDPNKKAEKALKFSEEHMLIAEKALESSDPKIKAAAQDNLNRAQDLAKTARTSQEQALQKPTDETTRLLKNSAAAADRQQQIFDRIEQKSSGESLDKVLEARKNITDEGKGLDAAINNDKIPQEVRDHLKDVKARIEQHATEIDQRVTEVKQLQDAVANGDESAKAKLEQFRTDRMQEVEKSIEEHQAEFQKFQDKFAELKASAEKGDAKAVELLKQVDQMPDLKNRFEQMGKQFMNQNEQNESGDEQNQQDNRRGPPPGMMNRPGGDDQGTNRPDNAPIGQQGEQTQPRPGFFSRVQNFLQRKGSDQPSSEQQPSNDQQNAPDQKDQEQNRPGADENSGQNRMPRKGMMDRSRNGENEQSQDDQGTEQKPGFFSGIKNFLERKTQGSDVNTKTPEGVDGAEGSSKQMPPPGMMKPFQGKAGGGSERDEARTNTSTSSSKPIKFQEGAPSIQSDSGNGSGETGVNPKEQGGTAGNNQGQKAEQGSAPAGGQGFGGGGMMGGKPEGGAFSPPSQGGAGLPPEASAKGGGGQGNGNFGGGAPQAGGNFGGGNPGRFGGGAPQGGGGGGFGGGGGGPSGGGGGGH